MLSSWGERWGHSSARYLFEHEHMPLLVWQTPCPSDALQFRGQRILPQLSPWYCDQHADFPSDGIFDGMFGGMLDGMYDGMFDGMFGGVPDGGPATSTCIFRRIRTHHARCSPQRTHGARSCSHETQPCTHTHRVHSRPIWPHNCQSTRRAGRAALCTLAAARPSACCSRSGGATRRTLCCARRHRRLTLATASRPRAGRARGPAAQSTRLGCADRARSLQRRCGRRPGSTRAPTRDRRAATPATCPRAPSTPTPRAGWSRWRSSSRCCAADTAPTAMPPGRAPLRLSTKKTLANS